MPFANCNSCGRLFHFLDPTLPKEASGSWDVDRDVLCAECRRNNRNGNDRGKRDEENEDSKEE